MRGFRFRPRCDTHDAGAAHDRRFAFRIPHPYDMILAGRDNAHPIGRELNTIHFLRMLQNGRHECRGKNTEWLASFAIPGTDQFVVAGVGTANKVARAIWAECDLRAAFRIRWSTSVFISHALAGLRVP